MAKILLVEPAYNNKYPPLGLMKIATYHKKKNDEIIFIKGYNKELKEKKWDRIYITTLFTFYWKKTVDTIKYYYNSVDKPSDIYVGGVTASILFDDLKNEPGLENITIISGLLNKPGVLDNDDEIVDELIPDYSIIDTSLNKYLDYQYPTNNSYIAYATRGCIRNCKFCAVPTLEPKYKDYISLEKQVKTIKELYGERRNLLLLDNNVLASEEFPRIINDIINLGFGSNNNVYTYTKNKREVSVRRYVDFNQGTDARLLTPEKMELLSRIAIKPLRIAFDYATVEYVNLYKEKVRLAAEYKIETLSNYILYNFENDTPDDLYNRLKINIELNQEFSSKGLKTQIWSFPMRYSPIRGDHSKDRKYYGRHWNKKYIRSIQCILSATHGVVGPKTDFFNKAFGRDLNEFSNLLIMPEDYIIYRKDNEENGNTFEWLSAYEKLGERKSEFTNIIKDSNFKNLSLTYDKELNDVLKHYLK